LGQIFNYFPGETPRPYFWAEGEILASFAANVLKEPTTAAAAAPASIEICIVRKKERESLRRGEVERMYDQIVKERERFCK
jgi:hypothetical protein